MGTTKQQISRQWSLTSPSVFTAVVIIVVLFFTACCAATIAADNIVPASSIRVKNGFAAEVSDHQLVVQPGAYWVNDLLVSKQQPTVVSIPAQPRQAIKGDAVTFSKDSSGNFVGVLPACNATSKVKVGAPDVLVPGSLVLRQSQFASPYVLNKDYKINGNGVVTKIKGGSLDAVSQCFADYSINLRRVDSIAADEKGNIRFAAGAPVKWSAMPLPAPGTLLPLFNVYSYSSRPLTTADVLAISSEPPPILLTSEHKKNREALKDVIDKLEHGKPVRIAFWGDDATAGVGASSPDKSFPTLFVAALRKRYPKSEITVDMEAKIGCTTASRGPGYYKEVLVKYPDLIVISFMNDMFYPPTSLNDRYVQDFKAVKMVKGDTICIDPHIPSTSFIPEKDPNGFGSMTFTNFLRNLCSSDPTVALADVAKRYEFSGKEGVKAESLLLNGVHPNDRGHEIYAEELLKCFE